MSDYEYLPYGWREIAELLSDIRDELSEMNARANAEPEIVP